MNNTKYQVLWLSRHEMSAEQLADLADYVNWPVADIQVTAINHTWQATSDGSADDARNRAEWKLFFDRIPEFGGCVAGVFPPVALTVLRKGTRAKWWRILSPVSEPDPAARKDANAQMPFRHLRFVEL